MAAVTKTTCLLLLLLCCHRVQAQRYAVLIHEIMPDPQPAVGLPDAEYIELRNVGQKTIDLSGWRLLTSTAGSGRFPAFLLRPDSLVVVTAKKNKGLFGIASIGVSSFPALPNEGTLLQLHDAAGNVVHAVNYQSAWYPNKVKAEGGWSLEMVDAQNPCNGSTNWKAATALAGGTPGSINSAAAANTDETPPVLHSATTQDATHLLLRFDESMDSSALANPGYYTVEPRIAVLNAQPVSPLFDAVYLTLAASLEAGKIYSVKANNLTDCAGNAIGSRNSVKTGLPQTAQKDDLIINEILFDPKPDGSDYVEVFNRGNKIIDIAGIWMTTNSRSGDLQKIAGEPLYLFPGEYLVITEERDAILRNYLVTEDRNLVQVSRMPSLPDDGGSFALLNEQGSLIDAVNYTSGWHFALIANAEGVALERIDPEKPTQEPANWTSAAASAGFGTPTYRNSQYRQSGSSHAVADVSPKVFSPDNDGFDDFCTINFQLTAPNYVANLSVFDAGGRKVRHLVQNQTLAQSGSWRWDGLGENKQVLASGTYILLLELFDLQGKKQRSKMAVTLARR